MNTQVNIDAGICGFHTTAYAHSQDSQHVTFDVESPCEKIQHLAIILKEKGPIDAYQEISPVSESLVIQAVRSILKGCCAGCAVPVGLFKAMQVAAGLALPKDILIEIRT